MSDLLQNEQINRICLMFSLLKHDQMLAFVCQLNYVFLKFTEIQPMESVL